MHIAMYKYLFQIDVVAAATNSSVWDYVTTHFQFQTVVYYYYAKF